MRIRGKYGRLAPRPEVQSRLLRLASYTSSALPAPPPDCDWTPAVTGPWLNWWNDTLGDCTVETAGHLLMSMSANASAPIIPTAPQILTPYEAVGGYDPATGANDDGLVLTDLLDYWGRTGIAGNRIKGYVRLNVNNLNQIKQAIYRFGGVALGIRMPQSAEDQFDLGKSWTRTWWPTPIVGGHAVPALSYTRDGLGVITWGEKQGLTWDWYEEYCEEAYAILDLIWLNSRGQTPVGLALNQLISDLGQLPMSA